MITGTEFFRRKRRMSKSELAQRAGISPDTLKRLLSDPDVANLPLYPLDRVSRVLGVSLDEVLETYDERMLDDGGYIRASRTESRDNCIAIYRREKGLTFEALGKRLGRVSRECARQICAMPDAPAEKVLLLAMREGITPEEFRCRYTPADEGEVCE